MNTCQNEPLLSGKHLSKSYSGQQILSDISVDLYQGEIVSVLGVSGIGKTTLFNILSGLEHPDQGEVFLCGKAVTGRPGLVSYMQQKDLLLPFRTVLDNVIVPLTLRGVDKKTARKQASAYFADFGLCGCEKLYPDQLSGGMRQRAAVLRSYLYSGEIMLLDEPFSALDALTKTAMHSWYNNIARSKGSSAFLITHDIDEAIVLSDRIYIMNGPPGKITYQIRVDYPGKRDMNFTMTTDFIQYKQAILHNFK